MVVRRVEGVYIGWYDREPASSGNNDLTRYHAAFLRYRPDNILSQTKSLTPFRPVDVSRVALLMSNAASRRRVPRVIWEILKTARGSRSYRVPGAGGSCATPGAARCDFSDSATATPSLACCLGSGSPEYRRLQRDCVCRPARLYRVGGYAARRSSCPSRKLCWNVLRCPDPCLDNNDSLWRVGRVLRRPWPGSDKNSVPDELCDIRVPVPKLCEKVIACPVCDRNGLCTGNDGFRLQGLPRESTLALVDDHERAVQRASKWRPRHYA